MMLLRRLIFPLLFALERASSSLSTIEKLSVSNQAFFIRQAKLEDIPSINRCNIENLPENYDFEFYHRHLT